MNRTKIEWCDYTWNPVTGCLHGCSYCYARRLANRFYGGDFSPRFRKDWLDKPKFRKTPTRIFPSSMGDLFGEWVPAEWIQAVIEVCRECPQHIFMFLTKNPKRYAEFEFPPNCWLGMSVTGSENATPLYVISNLLNKNVKFISWEPIITTILYKHYRNIDWLIMGAMTGPGAKQHQPDPWWIENAVGGCRNNHIPIFMKDSIKPFYEGELIREWPERRA